jgi:hypothetical protein
MTIQIGSRGLTRIHADFRAKQTLLRFAALLLFGERFHEPSTGSGTHSYPR